MLPAGLGIAAEGADVLLQEGMGPAVLPDAAAPVRAARWDVGQEQGALILWLWHSNQYVSYLFLFKRSEGCWLRPCFGEFEDQSCVSGVPCG